MEENRLTRIFKIAIAILVLLALGVIGGMVTAISAEASAPAQGTMSIKLEEYRTYTFYPDGYSVDRDEIKPFEGTYVLTGNPSEDIVFRSNGEPVTYNVVFHNLEAVSDTWYGMMGVDPNVTVNITVYGDNVLYGHNHPGISIASQREGTAPIVNITMTEGSRLSIGSLYHETLTCIAPGITVNLIGGESSIDMSQEGWQNNKKIEFTNGKEYSHKMKYVYADESNCSYECDDCDIVGAIKMKHNMGYTCYEKEHPDYSVKHIATCYECGHEFEATYHSNSYVKQESTHAEQCYECGYKGEATPHTVDGGVCTACDMKHLFLHQVDGEETYIFLTQTLVDAMKEKGGRVTLLGDIKENYGTTLNIAHDTVIDLAGYQMQGVGLNVGEEATLSIVDTSKDKSGQWNFQNPSASYVSGTLNLEGITLDSVSLIVHNGGALTIKDVTSQTKLFVRVGAARAEINGLTSSGYLDLNIDAYWSDLELNISNVTLGKLVVSTNYGQDVSINMLLPEGYAFSGEDGLLDGSGTEIQNVTAIVEHSVHNNDNKKSSSKEHWLSCTCGYDGNAIKELHTLGADGNCGACGEKIVATITSDGETVYHTNLADAILDTINYAESTVTLLCDFKPESYKELDIKKKVVLDLNGYTYYTNGRLRVWDSLTIIDSSEGKTGKIWASGDISYIIEFYNDSSVTINGGELFGLIYSAIYGEGTATITINGGKFVGKEKFRLNNGTVIVINGGVFECAESLFNMVWASKVEYEINGGVFINCTVIDTDEYTPILENMVGKDGDCELCFINSAGNALTLEELCGYYEGEIFVFHKNASVWATDKEHGLYCFDCEEKTIGLIHSPVYAVSENDSSMHDVMCKICEWEMETSEHTGGEANCTYRAECEYCQASYGELSPNSHSGGVAFCNSLAKCKYCKKEYGEYSSTHSSLKTAIVADGENHNKIKPCCGEVLAVLDHTYDNSCDTECNDCKATRAVTHTYGNDGKCTVCQANDPNKQGADNSDTQEPSDKVGTGVIIGIIIGALVIVVAVGLVLVKIALSRKYTNI